MVNLEELRRFLVSSALAGYASGDTSREVKEADGSTSIVIEDGPWRSHDNWDGGEPYCGRIRVSYEGKAVWSMVYYGRVFSHRGRAPLSDLYGHLISALQKMPLDAPYRGPAEHREGEWSYTNKWEGSPKQFSGTERIFLGSGGVYAGWYLGGLINTEEG